jgi:putative transcriptional regulator
LPIINKSSPAARIERAKQNITQAELAERVGVSRQTINSIEIGKFVPSTALALKIAFKFNTTVNDIFILEDTDWN